MYVYEFIKRRDLGKSSDVQLLRTTFSSARTRVYSICAFNLPKRIVSLLLIILRKNNIMTSKFSSSNNAVRRISQEVKEFLDSERQMEDGNEDQQKKDGSKMMDNNAFATWAEPLEDDIFEWHFAIYGAEGARERI